MRNNASHIAPLRRRAFTLVELMAVIVLMGILFTMVLSIAPSDEKRAAARAADQLQGWMLQARTRAMRDQQPRGLQMVKGNITTASAGTFTTFVGVEFIEQPEPFVPVATLPATATLPYRNQPARLFVPPPPPGEPTLSAGQARTRAWLAGFNNEGSAIQIGDFLEISLGTVTVHQIIGVQVNQTKTLTGVGEGGPQLQGTILTLGSSIKQAEAGTELVLPARSWPNGTPTPTPNYRIIRTPRAMAGEPAMMLPKDTIIDVGNPNLATWGRITPGSILFSPSGAVMSNNSTSRVIFWVRHVDNKGEPTLISVSGRTGSIAAHPVNTAGNPFSFTEDGLGSGL